MFRSTDDLTALVHSKLTMSMTVYVKFKYTVLVLGQWGFVVPCGFAATILEEAGEQSGGFVFEEAFFDEERMIEAGIGGDVVESTGVSGFGIWGGVD